MTSDLMCPAFAIPYLPAVRRHPRVAKALAEAQGFAGGTQAGIWLRLLPICCFATQIAHLYCNNSIHQLLQ